MIGVLDSGIGGLSVLREVRAVLPAADLTYVADRANAPYGTKSLDEVRSLTHEVVRWLADRSANPIVVACNTASAAALDSLRDHHRGISFVGMEPAVKPAASSTETGVVGVLATRATFQGKLFRSVVSRFGGSAEIITAACPEWVSLVESGEVRGPVAETAVRSCVEPLIARGADLLVIGCTHFSFLVPLIAEVAGSGVRIIDPAPAVAAQTVRVWAGSSGTGKLLMAASGDIDEFRRLAESVGRVKTGASVLPFPQ
jgi:glutamate racemase